MLLAITSFEITHQQGVPSLHSDVDVIDQLLPVHSAWAFEQIAATADDRHKCSPVRDARFADHITSENSGVSAIA